MVTLMAFATDERIARIALATIAEPGDTATGHIVSSHGAVAAVAALADDGPIPGFDDVEAQLWCKRLTPNGELRLIREALNSTEQGGFETLLPLEFKGSM